MRTPSITSPYAPDIEKGRAWLETKIAARLFVEIVAAKRHTPCEYSSGGRLS